MSPQNDMSQTAILAEYLANAATTPLPDAVVESGKMHLLDTLSSIISGSAMPAGVRGRAWSELAYGKQVGPSSVLGSNLRTSPFVAATCNGMSAHADETDDSHGPSLSHPGCSVLPAALAVAESVNGSGTLLLRAFVAGYDIGCRVGRAAQSFERTGRDIGRWSSHAVVGAFCSAGAAATSYQLDHMQSRYLFSYACQLASGVTTWMRDTHHVEKSFVFAGMPAGHGVLAASLVASGCDGVDDVFGGAPNWLEAIHKDSDPSELTADLGVRYEVMEATIKKLAVGSPSQAAVDAMLGLIDDGLRPEGVVEIEVHLDPKGATVVDNRNMPNVNIQYLLTGTLLDGQFSRRMSHDQTRMQDPVVRDLMSRIRLVKDDVFLGVRSAMVRAVVQEKQNRKTYERTVMHVRGHPKNPMSFDEVATKASDLIGEVLGAETAKRINDAVFSIENLQSVEELVQFCRPVA